jgi:hypothetical protein
MDDQNQRAMMFRIIGAYVELSLFTAQRQLLTSRNPQQWMVDKSFGSIIQNAPQFIAQANAPVPQMQPFNMNQAQQVLTQMAGSAPQQGQVTQPPPVPPAPGHWEWDATKQDYDWIPNP